MKPDQRMDKIDSILDALFKKFDELKDQSSNATTELRIELAKIEGMFKVITEQNKGINDKIQEIEKDNTSNIRDLKSEITSIKEEVKDISLWKSNLTGRIAVWGALAVIAVDLLIKFIFK